MDKEIKDVLSVRRKMVVLEYARLCGNVAKACREFEIPRSSFYKWKKAFNIGGKAGLARKKPIALSHPGKLLHTVRADRGHELQAQFHWHVEDKRDQACLHQTALTPPQRQGGILSASELHG